MVNLEIPAAVIALPQFPVLSLRNGGMPSPVSAWGPLVWGHHWTVVVKTKEAIVTKAVHIVEAPMLQRPLPVFRVVSVAAFVTLTPKAVVKVVRPRERVKIKQ